MPRLAGTWCSTCRTWCSTCTEQAAASAWSGSIGECVVRHGLGHDRDRAHCASIAAKAGVDDAARGHLDDRIEAHGVGTHAERRATLSLSTPSADGPCGSGDASRATQRQLSREDRGYRARGSQVHKRQPLDHGPMCRRTRLQLDAHQLASTEDRPGTRSCAKQQGKFENEIR